MKTERKALHFGADVSTLLEIERLGGVYTDRDGNKRDLVELLKARGVSRIRLRLWVDPYTAAGESYGAGDCGLHNVLRLARRVKEAGLSFLLDLHYSDFWCDPARQGTPKAWRGAKAPALARTLYDYTASTLDAFDKAGVPPMEVALGNEITNGFLWPSARLYHEAGHTDNYDTLCLLLNAASAAAGESSDAKRMLHLENSGNNALWREWLDQVTAAGVAFESIGASYYPFWHGDMAGLVQNLSDVSRRYQKEVQVVETAYPFTAKPFREDAPLVIHAELKTAQGQTAPYPFTREGQKRFLSDLILALSSIPKGRCTALYWWEPGWLPVEGSSWASKAALIDIGETDKPTGNEWANQCLFDYEGRETPALALFEGETAAETH